MYNSTIVSKKKMLSCGHFDFNFSKGRCKSCATIQSFNRRQEKEITSEGLQDLISDLDLIFSRYVRLSASDVNGEAICYTCGYKCKWSALQCGHFISRICMFLRFDVRNVRPQCQNCNEYKRGNLIEFRKRLENEHHGITEILEEESRMIYKFTRDELRGMINEYSQKLLQLKK